MKHLKFQELVDLKRAVTITPKYPPYDTAIGFPLAVTEEMLLMHELIEFHLPAQPVTSPLVAPSRHFAPPLDTRTQPTTIPPNAVISIGPPFLPEELCLPEFRGWPPLFCWQLSARPAWLLLRAVPAARRLR